MYDRHPGGGEAEEPPQSVAFLEAPPQEVPPNPPRAKKAAVAYRGDEWSVKPQSMLSAGARETGVKVN